MHIIGMTIGGIPPFTEPVKFEFDERVNVFIGPNAVGKSTVLRLLEIIAVAEGEVCPEIFTYGKCTASVSDDWPRRRDGNDFGSTGPVWDLLPFISVSATRLSLPRIGWVGEIPDPPQDKRTLESILNGYSLDLFDGPLIERATDLIAKEAGSRITPVFEHGELSVERSFEEPSINLEQAMNIGLSCSKQICPEIIQGSSVKNFVDGGDNLRDNLFVRLPDVRVGMAIDTADGDSLGAYWLSSGTQSTLLWIRLITLRMVHYYGYKEGWQKQPAILLIDEIENHLHPTWQRRVIPALLEHFPGLQIFATTHSPFVVAGLKAGQVHLLNRNENGVITATTNTEDIVGWTADEILRVYMGVDDPTDEDTATAARELRKLRDEGPRADERAEEERLAEMRRLRSIVDRAELSGPRAAEDERFLADLRSILHRYSQSQNLNQENG